MSDAKSYLFVERTTIPSLANHPDTFTIAPNEQGTIGIEAIKSLKEWVYLKPFIHDEKIALLVEFNKATIEAQNSLLKILEEPPLHTIIIVHTDDAANLLPTVVSRCQRITLENISEFPVTLGTQNTQESLQKLHEHSLLIDNFIGKNQSSFHQAIINAEKLSKLDRKDLILLMDIYIKKMYSESNAKIALTFHNAKKRFLKNLNTRLVLDSLFFSLFEKSKINIDTQ